jgi:hypothetical protein
MKDNKFLTVAHQIKNLANMHHMALTFETANALEREMKEQMWLCQRTIIEALEIAENAFEDCSQENETV